MVATCKGKDKACDNETRFSVLNAQNDRKRGRKRDFLLIRKAVFLSQSEHSILLGLGPEKSHDCSAGDKILRMMDRAK